VIVTEAKARVLSQPRKTVILSAVSPFVYEWADEVEGPRQLNECCFLMGVEDTFSAYLGDWTREASKDPSTTQRLRQAKSLLRSEFVTFLNL
jgi:hypothetical protein